MKITSVLPFAVLVVLAGCDSKGTERPAPTDIRVFDAAPNYEAVVLRREQRVESQLQLGNGEGKTIDSGPYDFYLDFSVAGSAVPVAGTSFSLNLSPDLDYLFVPVSPGGQLDALIVTTEDIPASDTTSRFTFVHAHPGFGAFDVYMVDAAQVTDCMLAGSTKRGGLSYGPTPLSFEQGPGTYRICLTAPGDPNTVLFESNDIPFTNAGADVAFIAFDDGGLRTTDLSLSAMDSSAIRLSQVGVDARVRVIQDVDDGLDRNVFRNDETTPLFAAPLPAGQLSDYVTVSSASPSDIKLVPLGGGDPEATLSIALTSGRNFTIIYAGDTTDGINAAAMAEDTRSIVGQASLRFVHAAGMHDSLEIFVRAPGTDITDAIPNTGFSLAPGVTPRYSLVPGDYEITIRDAVTKALLAGPDPLPLADGGVYGVLILNDRADPAAVSLQYLYDLAP